MTTAKDLTARLDELRTEDGPHAIYDAIAELIARGDLDKAADALTRLANVAS
jgi:hypothetical protein